MRNVCSLAALGLFSVSALCQTTPDAGSDSRWARVQQLSPGTAIHVRTGQGSTKCAFRSADAGSLVCAHGGDTTYQRSDVRSISLSHRLRSTGIGFVVGGGIGAISGEASTKPNGILNPGAVAGIFGVAGAVVGGAIGAATDFSHSTLYKSH